MLFGGGVMVLVVKNPSETFIKHECQCCITRRVDYPAVLDSNPFTLDNPRVLEQQHTQPIRVLCSVVLSTTGI